MQAKKPISMIVHDGGPDIHVFRPGVLELDEGMVGKRLEVFWAEAEWTDEDTWIVQPKDLRHLCRCEKGRNDTPAPN